MQTHNATTPFGRRSLSLAHVANQAIAKARPSDKTVNKWIVFRAICAAKDRIGVTERALAVLDALLSFHPETVLEGEGLIVFPSNEQLALRAHGMPPSTLRRHLVVLVDAGLSCRELFRRMRLADEDPATIDAIIVTHQIPSRVIRGHYLGLKPEEIVRYEQPHAGIMRLSAGTESHFGD